jgi:hypothetical protein
MTTLVVKRASAFRPDGQWKDEDYDVLADGKVVGRIYEDDPLALPDLRWFWSITSIWPATPGVTSGTAATREEAMAKFRAVWDAKQGTPAPLNTFAIRASYPGRHRKLGAN